MAKIKEDGTVEFSPEELTPPESVDYFIYSTSIAREHKHAENWKALCIVLLIITFLTNLWWIYRELSYENVSVEQTVKQSTEDGGNNTNTLYAGDYYGYADGYNESNGTEKEN